MIKGAKGASFLSVEQLAWIKGHNGLILLFAFGGLALPGLTRAPLRPGPVFVDLVAAPKPAAAPKPRRQVLHPERGRVIQGRVL